MENLHYIKFRWTLEEGIVEEDTNIKLIMQRFKQSGVIDPDNTVFFICGFENKDKFGKPTHPHIHMHFTSGEEPKFIRDRFRKWIKTHTAQKQKRCELYSLKEIDCEDVNRFLRYPMKQLNPLNVAVWDTFSDWINYPDDFDPIIEGQKANDEWVSAVEHNNKALEKHLRPTTFDKIEDYLEALNLENPSEDLICEKIVEYYKENKLSANFSTMMGYCNTYRLTHGLMSVQEAVREMKRKK